MNRPSFQPIADRLVAVTIAGAALLIAWGAAVPARDKSADTCLSNLRRIGIASRMYSDDYNGHLVPYAFMASGANPGSTYGPLLMPYVKDVSAFRCPSDHINASYQSQPVPTTYGINWYLSGAAGSYGGGTLTSSKYTSLRDPARTIWVADSAVIDPVTAALPASAWREDTRKASSSNFYYFYLPQNPNTGAVQADGWSSPNFNGYIVRPFPRHHGRVNCAFYDGHAASVPASQFDPKNNPENGWGQSGCLWDNVAG